MKKIYPVILFVVMMFATSAFIYSQSIMDMRKCDKKYEQTDKTEFRSLGSVLDVNPLMELSRFDNHQFDSRNTYNFTIIKFPAPSQGDVTQLEVQPRGVVETYPPVTNLNSSVSGTNVTLSWNAPVNRNINENIILEEGFEGESAAQGWGIIDADGDGKNWGFGSVGAEYVHSGVACVFSVSFENSTEPDNPGGVPIDPNNYLVTPELDLPNGGTLTYWVASHEASPQNFDHYGVFISTSGSNVADFSTTPLLEEVASNIWTEKIISLPPDTKYVAFRHYNSYDKFIIKIDDVKITDGDGGTPTPPGSGNYTYSIYRDNIKIADNLTANTYADSNVATGQHEYCVEVNYPENNNSEQECKSVNVVVQSTYPPVTNLNSNLDATKVTLTWNAPALRNTNETIIINENFDEEGAAQGWISFDADGDGKTWSLQEFGNAATHSGEFCAISVSFENNPDPDQPGSPLNPDNYFITPELNLPNGGTLTYWVASQEASSQYFDHYGVFYSTSGSSVADFNPTPLIEEVASNTWTEHTISLPAGTKFVAFRHYNSSDKFIIKIDDVKITDDSGDSPDPGLGDYTYSVYRDDVKIVDNLNATTYTDLNVPYGQHNYCVEVNYEGNNNSTLVCKLVNVLQEQEDYPPITGLVVSTDANTASLVWTPPVTNLEFSYSLYRDNLMIVENLNTPAYTDSNLAPGEYEFCVEVNYPENHNSEKPCVNATIVDNNIEELADYRIIINGANACINFDIETAIELSIYDARGKLITKTVKEGFSSDAYTPGLYLVYYTIGNNQNVLKVIVK